MMPVWLTKITKKICERTGLFPSPINHVLINEYLPDQGIMPHQDGPAYFPVVAILSLGSPAVMNFTPHPRLKECINSTRNVAENSASDEGAVEIGSEEQLKDENHNSLNRNDNLSVLLRPCSLLIFKDTAYVDYLHGIEDSNIHSLDGVVNVGEVLKHQEPSSLKSLEDALKTKITEEHIHRTSTRPAYASLPLPLEEELCQRAVVIAGYSSSLLSRPTSPQHSTRNGQKRYQTPAENRRGSVFASSSAVCLPREEKAALAQIRSSS
ncbi:hypothetical protein ACLOJK_000054 [Asimina triloba]